MLYTDDSHLASDKVDEQSTKEDWIIQSPKMLHQVSVEILAVWEVAGRTCIYSPNDLNLRKDGVIIYPLYRSEFIVSVKKMSDYSCFAESTPYSNLMSCYTTSCSMYWSVIMC